MTPTLTERLVLRPFSMADCEALARLYADDVIMRHLVPGRGLQRDDAAKRARAGIINANDHWRRFGYGIWAVTDRASGRLIGQCGLRRFDQLDQVELVYLLNKTCWGRGLASEAARAALLHGFGAGLPAVVALVRPENAASHRVLEKLGVGQGREVDLWGMRLTWYEAERLSWLAASGAAAAGNEAGAVIPPPALPPRAG